MSLRPEFPSTLTPGCPEHPHGRTFVVYLVPDRRMGRIAYPVYQGAAP